MVYLRFTFNIFIYYFKLSDFVQVYTDTRGLGSPEARVTGGREQPEVSVGNLSSPKDILLTAHC